MFGLGSQELLVILVIVMVLFGANRLPRRPIARVEPQGIQEGPRLGPRRGDCRQPTRYGQPDIIGVGQADLRAVQDRARSRLDSLPTVRDGRASGPDLRPAGESGESD
jgi:hypothetical protein